MVGLSVCLLPAVWLLAWDQLLSETSHVVLCCAHPPASPGGIGFPVEVFHPPCLGFAALYCNHLWNCAIVPSLPPVWHWLLPVITLGAILELEAFLLKS